MKNSFAKRSYIDSRVTSLAQEPNSPRRQPSPREEIRRINSPPKQRYLAYNKQFDRVEENRIRQYQQIVDRFHILDNQNRRLSQQVIAWRQRVDALGNFKNQELTVKDLLHQNELQAYRRQNFSQVEAMADQINMLKHKICQRQNQIDELKNDDQFLQHDNKILRETNLRLTDLEMKTAAMLSQLNARNVDCDKLAMRASQLQARLNQNQEENYQLRVLIDGKTRQNAALESQIGHCQVDMSNLRNQQTLDKQNQGRLLANIHQLDLKIAHQEAQIDNLKNANRGEYEKYRDYSEKVKQAFLARERQAADLRQKNTTLLDNLNGMKQREYELRQELAVLKQKFDIYSTEKQHQIQALQDQISVLHNQINLKEKELFNLNQKINRAENKIDQLLFENSQLSRAIDGFKQELDDMERIHIANMENRDARHRADLQDMDQNFNQTVESYLNDIQDLKNLIEQKESDILGVRKEYLNQAQQNQTLMKRQDGIIEEINQVKARIQQIQREKEFQLAQRDQKQRNQLENIKALHTAELENLRAQNNQLELLYQDRNQENQELKAQGRNLMDNLAAVKASQSRLFNQNQQLKGRAGEFQHFKNKEISNQEDLRRSHTIATSKQFNNEIQNLQNIVAKLKMKCDGKAKESQQWRRQFYNIREGRPYGTNY